MKKTAEDYLGEEPMIGLLLRLGSSDQGKVPHSDGPKLEQRHRLGWLVHRGKAPPYGEPAPEQRLHQCT